MSIQPERIYPAWTLGDRIRKARLCTGLNQRDFAPLIGAQAGSLAAWETDRSIPRDIVALAKRIQSLTHVPAGWILGIDDGPDDNPDGPGGIDHPTGPNSELWINSPVVLKRVA